ncbi:MAG: flippase-like domain-containing protein [Candidatus Bathyarchaeota archaeon]|nr:MAG: flippase-like domain-containing protein [Candidatus Bathyarchaeota archaeon]
MAATRKWRGLILTSMGLIIFAVYLAYSKPFRVLLEVGRFDAATFALAVLINYAGLFFFSASWYVLLRVLGVGVSLLESVRAMFVSLFVIWLVPIPVGTEIIRAYLVRDEENSGPGKAIASVVVHKAYYNISFGFLIALAALMVTVFRGGSIPVRPELVLFVILFAAGSSTLYGLFLSPGLLMRAYDRSPDWVRRNVFDRLVNPRMREEGFPAVVEEIGSAVKTLMARPLSNFLSILMVAFHWSTGALTSYLVALSLGWPIDFWAVVLVYALIEFIQQLNVFIPGGLGIIDASLTGAFVILGVPLSFASAISLLTRMATYWLELALCAGVSLLYGYKESLKEYLQ